MKVGALGTWRPRIFSSSNGRAEVMGIKNQEHICRELHQTWHKLALQVLGSNERLAYRVTGITSAVRGEGKTTNSLGLVTARANETEEKVLLVECDLYSPSIASHLGLSPKPGLSEYVAGEGSIVIEKKEGEGRSRRKTSTRYHKPAIQNTNLTNLDVIVAGGDSSQDQGWNVWNEQIPSRLRKMLPDVLEDLKQEYPYIVLDMPPILTNPYAREMVSALDKVFVTSKADVTELEDLSRVAQELGDKKPSGVILIGSNSRLPSWLARVLPE